jgi:hypothetical protein
MSDRPFVDCTCGHQLASMRMDREELDEALDGDLREVCLLCGAVRLYARSDYYFPLRES